METFDNYYLKAPNALIQEQLIRSNSIIHRYIKEAEYNETCITCSISGGSDSDILLDICHHIYQGNLIKYVFFDTGIEMQATKDHLDFLENKYQIQIERVKAKVPVPLGIKKYGVPFLAKKQSDYISRLQKHNFDWSLDSFDNLYGRFPKCKTALMWWCNEYPDTSYWNISRQKYLRDYMAEFPPSFPISDKCCNGAKKDTAEQVVKLYSPELQIIGIRKMEGGARSTAHANCFEPDNKHGPQHYPLFFFSDEDKQAYNSTYGVTNSIAYTEYGCKRTGCAGCPFNSKFEQELDMLKEFEPKLYLAANNIFKDGYSYIRGYRNYKENKILVK